MATRAKRRKRRFAHRTQPGAPPGVLVPDLNAPPTRIEVIGYGPAGHARKAVDEVQDIRPMLEQWPVTWVNVDGLGDTTVISELGELFGFHRLALEDVVHVHQRPKVEAYNDCLFIVAKMPLGGGTYAAEQIAMFLGPRYVVTFQERPGGDCLEAVRLRIQSGVGKAPGAGADHLMYAVLDAIIDHYFPLVELAGERLEEIEDELLTKASRGLMTRLHEVRRDLVMLRRYVWPLRDALNTLIRDTGPLIRDDTKVYLRDCHDHTVQLIDLVESYRDLASGLTDLHLSSVSHRTNEIMRVLTVISTIFIPLTFIAGVYGMNFDPAASPWNMPELKSRWGYPLVMLGMGLLAAAQLLYFWRRGWLGPPQRMDEATGPPSRDDDPR